VLISVTRKCKFREETQTVWHSGDELFACNRHTGRHSDGVSHFRRFCRSTDSSQSQHQVQSGGFGFEFERSSSHQTVATIAEQASGQWKTIAAVTTTGSAENYLPVVCQPCIRIRLAMARLPDACVVTWKIARQPLLLLHDLGVLEESMESRPDGARKRPLVAPRMTRPVKVGRVVSINLC